MIVYDKKLISSDWHILHKNIALYEYEYRKQFFPDQKNNLSKEKLEHFFAAANENEINNFLKIHNQNFLVYLKAKLNKKISENKISKFINLGDFIFNISENKIKLLKDLDIEKHIFDIFDLLKNKGIRSEIILGNHCVGVLEDEKLKKYYSNFFDEIKIYKYENNIVYTHYPIGFVEGYNNNQDSNYLIDETNKLENKYNPRINLHGHVHHRSFEGDKKMQYINAWWGNI